MKRTLASVSLVLMLLADGAAAAATSRDTVLADDGETRAGHQTVTRGDDGAPSRAEWVFATRAAPS